MLKKISIITQTLLVAAAVWIWQVGRPAWKQFNFALNNMQTPIPTPGYYFAGNANETCEVITRPDPSKISHCEDGARIAHKKLLITCDPGRPEWNPILGVMIDPSNAGAFWIYDYENDNSLQPVESVGFPTGRAFHPLGVDVLPATATEPAYAFVANIDIKASVVDIFTISDKAPYKAVYNRTLSHPFIHAPNSIAAISPTQLYVSIDHRFTARMPKWIAKLSFFETFLQAPFAWVTYVEILPSGRVKYSTAANFINFANGLALSRDGKELVVASSMISMLLFYDRDSATNKLTFREKVPVPFPPDNLHYDSSGNLIVSGNPHIPQMMEFAYGARPYSPSWITQISHRKPYPKGAVLPPDDLAAPFVKTSDRLPQHPKYEFTTVYYSDGSQYPCTSTGILDGQELVAMSLLGKGVLHCKPDPPDE